MCLFLGSQALSMSPVFKPSQNHLELQTRLQILSAVHFALVLLLLFFGGRLMALFSPIFLFAGSYTLQYQCLMFYILFSAMDIVAYIEPVGLSVQNYIKLGSPPH